MLPGEINSQSFAEPSVLVNWYVPECVDIFSQNSVMNQEFEVNPHKKINKRAERSLASCLTSDIDKSGWADFTMTPSSPKRRGIDLHSIARESSENRNRENHTLLASTKRSHGLASCAAEPLVAIASKNDMEHGSSMASTQTEAIKKFCDVVENVNKKGMRCVMNLDVLFRSIVKNSSFNSTKKRRLITGWSDYEKSDPAEVFLKKLRNFLFSLNGLNNHEVFLLVKESQDTDFCLGRKSFIERQNKRVATDLALKCLIDIHKNRKIGDFTEQKFQSPGYKEQAESMGNNQMNSENSIEADATIKNNSAENIKRFCTILQDSAEQANIDISAEQAQECVNELDALFRAIVKNSSFSKNKTEDSITGWVILKKHDLAKTFLYKLRIFLFPMRWYSNSEIFVFLKESRYTHGSLGRIQNYENRFKKIKVDLAIKCLVDIYKNAEIGKLAKSAFSSKCYEEESEAEPAQLEENTTINQETIKNKSLEFWQLYEEIFAA